MGSLRAPVSRVARLRSLAATAISAALSPATASCVAATAAGTFDLGSLRFVVHKTPAGWTYAFSACADVDARAAASGLCTDLAPAPAVQASPGACHALGRLAQRSVAPLPADGGASVGRVGVSVTYVGGDACGAFGARSISLHVACVDVAGPAGVALATVEESASRPCSYAAQIGSRAGCPLECTRDPKSGAVCGGRGRGECALPPGGGAAGCKCAIGFEGPVCSLTASQDAPAEQLGGLSYVLLALSSSVVCRYALFWRFRCAQSRQLLVLLVAAFLLSLLILQSSGDVDSLHLISNVRNVTATISKRGCFGPVSQRLDTVDIIIFSKDRPLRLLSLLESQARHVSGAGRVAVVFLASNALRQAAYARVVSLFKDVLFFDEAAYHAVPNKPRFQVAVEHALESFSSPYITPIVDEMVWLRATNLAHVAVHLATADSGGSGTFQLRLGMSYTNVGAANPSMLPSSLAPGDPRNVFCFAWFRQISPFDFASMAIVDAVVVSAPRLRSEWRAINYSHPGDLEAEWSRFEPTYSKECAHYFYQESSITNIEDENKVRSDRSRAEQGGGLDAAARELLAERHLNISSVEGFSPDCGHQRMRLGLIPLVGCT